MNRDSFAIDSRRQVVATLYLQRKFQSEIARVVGVDQKTVSRDLQVMQKLWLASSLRDFDALKAEQLAAIDKRERTAWEAWERSCHPREVTIREASEGGERESRKAIVRIEPQNGDPRFLEALAKCVDQRNAILGLIVERHDITGTVTFAVAERTRDANDRMMRLRRALPTGDPSSLAS